MARARHTAQEICRSKSSQHLGQNLIPTVRDEFEVHGLRLCYLNLHLANVLLKFSTNIDVLSIDQLYEMYGKPETLPIIRSNGEPVPDTMPAHAVQSFFLGKSMDDLALPVHRHAVLQKPTLWDIIGMKTMFSSEWATEDEVASQQVDVLGSMPADWYASWEGRSQFWDEEVSQLTITKGTSGAPLEANYSRTVCKNGGAKRAGKKSRRTRRLPSLS
ncbi:hypothetical protein ASPCAL01082 [Aspergillus calidoustus]|uniref:Uncharacterized protein n=1 Tax=Aspergillus calidoustus TaxID=454130 RepID=A0A0U5C277_ASPCI|nr:hypothetical protein ASPCAL01082 [Aspergillus calidoustus]